jgi:hypothetical protein
MPKTRRRRREEAEVAHAADHAACSGPLVSLSDELLATVLRFCQGKGLAALECTCRLFGRRHHASGESLAERVAAELLSWLQLGPPSLWATLTGASKKHQLHRATTPASRIKRFPVALAMPGASASFGPSGELWLADYNGRSIMRVGATPPQAGATQGALKVLKRYRMPRHLNSTAAAVAVSADGLRIAVSVQPHYAQEDDGGHGVLILCATTGATLSTFVDDFDVDPYNQTDYMENMMEFPSGIEWLRHGMHAGQLAIADYNKGRVQIRSADTGYLLRTVALKKSGRHYCVSGVAELTGDCLGVVPHSRDTVALVELSSLPASDSSRPRGAPSAAVCRQHQALTWLGEGECGMPICARGVDEGRTLAVSDGAHRCVLFWELDEYLQARQENKLASSARPKRAATLGGAATKVAQAVDYSTGEVVAEADRPTWLGGRELGRPCWRRLRVEAAERSRRREQGEVATESEDDDEEENDGDFVSADDSDEQTVSESETNDDDGDDDISGGDGDEAAGTADLLGSLASSDSSDDSDFDEGNDHTVDEGGGQAEDDQGNAEAAAAATSNDEDEDEDESDDSDESEDESSDDESLGEFGIWTSVGFDHKRGDMIVSDPGTRYAGGPREQPTLYLS